jgi:hypothetical protein
MTDIFVSRKIFTEKSTIGKLTFGGFECFTLEDTARRQKIQDKTCIPSGVYKVELRLSPRFQKVLPHLLDVPFFEDILIHSGNVPEATSGCLLVGKSHPSTDFIGESRDAFSLLFPLIEQEIKKGPLSIRITGGFSKDDFENRNFV